VSDVETKNKALCIRKIRESFRYNYISNLQNTVISNGALAKWRNSLKNSQSL